MTSNTYIEISKQIQLVNEIRDKRNELETYDPITEVDAWLKAKDECEEKYKKLGRWVVDTMEDLPF